ncbi:unnamed protein product [Echinostoma caproni]|uniref:WD_REPEATS_REGION domain-containing protein n=1 Tax=Echinostoma caproni TaxID=27848 RepID=A0A182ZZM7_9TREM|nr:unnamed protein product [Echinostoma caproni]
MCVDGDEGKNVENFVELWSTGAYNGEVWKYNEGEVTHVGLGHTSPITRLRIAPDQRRVITVSEDGAVYIWDMP